MMMRKHLVSITLTGLAATTNAFSVKQTHGIGRLSTSVPTSTWSATQNVPFHWNDNTCTCASPNQKPTSSLLVMKSSKNNDEMIYFMIAVFLFMRSLGLVAAV